MSKEPVGRFKREPALIIYQDEVFWLTTISAYFLFSFHQTQPWRVQKLKLVVDGEERQGHDHCLHPHPLCSRHRLEEWGIMDET